MLGKVEKLVFGGDGLIRHEGEVFFIPFVAPGEVIEFELTEKKKNFSKGRLLKVIEGANNRILPPCPYFGRCGGCQLQHLSYEAQLQYKQNAVKEALQKIAKIENLPEIRIDGTKHQWEYRRKIHLKKKGSEVGFIGYDNTTFVPIKKCIIYSNHELPYEKPISPIIVDGLEFETSREAFVQNHPQQSEKLYLDICSLLESLKVKKVLDLYCGIGITSILLGKRGICSFGIEMNAKAIAFAKSNAKKLGVTNVEFKALDAAKATFKSPDCVIVNPPRSGLSQEMVDRLNENKPHYIVYVSCMPSTLARDIAKLQNYQLKLVKAYDMFPQTAHVETLCLLKYNL